MTPDDPAAVADCVGAHVAWFTAKATLSAGWVWNDGLVRWAWVPTERTMHGLFPESVPTQTAERAFRDARRLRARSVAIWSDVDLERPELEDAGFEVGWQPWWMSAPTDGFEASAFGPAGQSRVRLTADPRPDDAGSAGLLTRPNTWRAEATVDGAYAGRAWIHLDGTTAGLFDMEVWPRFRRRGLGTELLQLLIGTAREHGAERAVLNATPEGAQLYRAAGFVRVGEGRTWWRHKPWWQPR
ncbi:MAG TPA: GNAT family N-acetyltransferase [Propionibacteriaceae bacterium]